MTKHADETMSAAPPPLHIAHPEADAPAPGKPLYGNEGYVSDHTTRDTRTAPTGAEWLAEAKEAETVLMRGDHVSPELIERLFLEAVPVIEGAMSGGTDPASRKAKADREK